MPPRDHVLLCRRVRAGRRIGAVGAGAAVSGRPRARLAPDRLEPLDSLTSAASRELETVHRRLLNLHLEKELKSARVLREMRQAR